MNDETPTEKSPEPDARRPGNASWLGGAILILLGLFFLLQNIAGFSFNNWWALFILIPAVGSLGTAWRMYQKEGRWGAAARGPLIGGVVLLLVTAMFLFNLDWGRLWPLFLILGGLGALATALTRD